jgi:mannose-6-phosphate isomerase
VRSTAGAPPGAEPGRRGPDQGHAGRNAEDYPTRNAEDHATRNADDRATRNAQDHTTRNAEDHATRNAEDHATRNAEDHATRNAQDPAGRDTDGHAARDAARAQSRRARGAPPPIVLPPNQVARFYRGGARIDRLRGTSGHPDRGPEDWVGSTTTTLGTDSDGLSHLPDGRYLRDAIAEDPTGFLGSEHVRRWGSNPALLVKLLDAGERLPVHFHPGRAFARRALGLDFGKTEAWIIVAAEPDSVVHLGLKSPVSKSTVLRWVREQDIPAVLGAMHELPVQPGATLFVPAGTLHAIGSGILLVELQEPTDLSVLLEWQRFGVSDGSEHLGLGWERVLDAAALESTRAEDDLDADAVAGATTPVADLLPAAAAPYFRAQQIAAQGEPVHLDQSFSILVVLDGWLTLWSESADPLDLHAGETVLVPHAAGPTTLDGHALVIRCRPPAPEAGAGKW